MSNFKTPIQRIFAPVFNVAVVTAFTAGCLGLIFGLVMLVFLIPVIFGVISWFVLDYFGSPYSIEIAVVVTIVAFLFGSVTRASVNSK